MARDASVAIGGYFATPDEQTRRIMSHLRWDGREHYTLLDPCAGDGAAILTIAKAAPSPVVHAIEAEATRHAAMLAKSRIYDDRNRWLCADAFRVVFGVKEFKRGASLLFLNPPYDVDPRYGRLEHRFLVRFTEALMPKGVLVFIVPFGSLHASAAFLARHYEELTCARFAYPDFDAFGQVVVFGRKRVTPLMLEDAELGDQVRAWANDPGALCEVGDPGASYVVPGSMGFHTWKIGAVDTQLLRDTFPALKGQHGGQFRQLGLSASVTQLSGGQVFPVAMPPRPGHIAQALAAGILNGHVATPDVPGLPDVLVKGVFEREDRVVEQKYSKDGDLVGEVTVQAPRLRLSVLDLTRSVYVDVKPGAEPTGARTLDEMNVADVVTSYTTSLIGAMRAQCPPLHDPTNPDHEMPLPLAARTPFWAQRHAIIGALKLIARGKHPIVMGEVGTGKSTIALITALAATPTHRAATVQALGRAIPAVRRLLIVCPPHLLDSWADQARAVVPGARVIVPQRISDLEVGATLGGDGIGSDLTIFILSRETAKLGHAHGPGTGAEMRCPKCGSSLYGNAEKIVAERLRCDYRGRRPADPLAEAAVLLARGLIECWPSEAERYVPGRVLKKQAQRAAWAMNGTPEEIRARRVASLGRLYGAAGTDLWTTPAGQILGALIDQINGHSYNSAHLPIVQKLLIGCPRADRDAVVQAAAERLFARGKDDRSDYGEGGRLRGIARELIGLIDDDDTWKAVDAAWQKATPHWRPASALQRHYNLIRDKGGPLCWRDGGRTIPLGSPEPLRDALRELANLGEWKAGPKCGEPLYQAIPEPRRYPLATYITRYHPELFDMLVLDEGHEFRTDGSAQERAAHRLSGLGKPVLLLSGSLANGYASGLFSNMWALSHAFRAEFSRGAEAEFVTRYGYRKQYIDVSDGGGRSSVRGSHTDRVEKRDSGARRQLGEAPGILPVFVLRHLLPQAVSIHKGDLERDLPPYDELREGVTPSPELAAAYGDVLGRVMTAIKRDRFKAGLAGRLFGAMAELPSYLDRCTADTGNNPAHTYRVAYPESVGGMLVAEGEVFDADEPTPKERWMLATLQRELAEGRNALVFVWHTNKENGLVARLQRLIKRELGQEAAFLDATKVSTAKRQSWIDKEVIGKRRRVMIVNPVTVQTGLNNLVYFQSALWLELIVDAVVWRQANGRLHRIGQDQPVRIYAPYYTGTLQQTALDLLAHKVVASMQVDGVDLEGALDASGAGEGSSLDAFALGQALYEAVLAQEEGRGQAPVPPPARETAKVIPMSGPLVQLSLFAQEAA